MFLPGLLEALVDVTPLDTVKAQDGSEVGFVARSPENQRRWMAVRIVVNEPEILPGTFKRRRDAIAHVRKEAASR